MIVYHWIRGTMWKSIYLGRQVRIVLVLKRKEIWGSLCWKKTSFEAGKYWIYHLIYFKYIFERIIEGDEWMVWAKQINTTTTGGAQQHNNTTTGGATWKNKIVMSQTSWAWRIRLLKTISSNCRSLFLLNSHQQRHDNPLTSLRRNSEDST